MAIIPPEYLELTYLNQTKKEIEHIGTLPFANSNIYYAKIKESKVLCMGENVKTVYDFALDLEGIHFDYKPGDAIGILPQNNENEVDQIIDRLHLNESADKTYFLTILKGTLKKKPIIPPHLPIYGTFRDVLLKYLDIQSIPKKVFLRCLLQYTSGHDDKEYLSALCNPKESEKYNKFICDEGRTLLGILQAIPTCQPPMERLFEHLPALLPRFYSISSSPLIKTQMHFTFSLIENGVCTSWLKKCSILPNVKIPFYFRKPNSFLSISNPNIPIIFIGPGTGVAPYIGFLQHRYLQKDRDFGNCTLFFGCRYSNQDFIYKTELLQFLELGLLNKLYTSFSRETEKKIYVQDKILENSKEIADKILLENATICVCGDGKNMAKDVEKAIINCFISHGKMKEDEANNFLTELRKSNKYQQDIWI